MVKPIRIISIRLLKYFQKLSFVVLGAMLISIFCMSMYEGGLASLDARQTILFSAAIGVLAIACLAIVLWNKTIDDWWWRFFKKFWRR